MSQQKIYLKIGLVAGLCHLSLVLCGAAGIEFSRENAVGRALSYYGELSGAGNSYGFFAPGVHSQIRARFEVVENDLSLISFQLSDGTNREVDLRINDIVEEFLREDDDDEENIKGEPMQFQRTLAASLSSPVFLRYPGAKSVTIYLESLTPVSMEEFRQGARAQWVPVYSAEFINKQNRVSND